MYTAARALELTAQPHAPRCESRTPYITAAFQQQVDRTSYDVWYCDLDSL